MTIDIKTRVRHAASKTKDAVKTQFTAPTSPANLVKAASVLIDQYTSLNESAGQLAHTWLEIDGQVVSMVTLIKLINPDNKQRPKTGPLSVIGHASNLIDQYQQLAALEGNGTRLHTPRDAWIMGNSLTQNNRRYLIHTKKPRFIARIVAIDQISGLPMQEEEPVISDGPFSFSTRERLFCEVTDLDDELTDQDSFKALVSEFATHVDTAADIAKATQTSENDALKEQLMTAGQFAILSVSLQYALAKQILTTVLGEPKAPISPESLIVTDLGADETQFAKIRAILTDLDIFLPDRNDDSLTVQGLANMMYPLSDNSTPGLRQ